MPPVIAFTNKGLGGNEELSIKLMSAQASAHLCCRKSLAVQRGRGVLDGTIRIRQCSLDGQRDSAEEFYKAISPKVFTEVWAQVKAFRVRVMQRAGKYSGDWATTCRLAFLQY